VGAGRNNALREEEKMIGRVDGSEHVNFAILLTINIFCFFVLCAVRGAENEKSSRTWGKNIRLLVRLSSKYMHI